MILVDNRERTRFLKFITVGAIGSIIDLSIMNLLTRLFDLPLVYAGSISFVCAVCNNFTLNRFWTFPDSRSKHLLHQLGMFFMVNSIGIGIRIPILHYLEPVMLRLFGRYTHLSSGITEALAKNATLISAIGIAMLWNFFVNRYWTFNDIE